VMVQRSGGFEETPDLLDPEDGGKAMFVLGAHERPGRPVAREDVRVEEWNGAVAETHGSGGRGDRQFCDAGSRPDALVLISGLAIDPRTERAGGPHGHRLVGCVRLCP